MMRPQLGSPPFQLVFTSALFATARAAASASAKFRAPWTRTVTKRDTPSPSRTIIFASSRQTWLRTDWNIANGRSRRGNEAERLVDLVRLLASFRLVTSAATAV